MNQIIYMRSNIMCFIILIYLLIYDLKSRKNHKFNTFEELCAIALLCNLLDSITVYTVNNLDIIPTFLNNIFHILFYFFGVTYVYHFFCYVLKNTLPNNKYLKYRNIYFIPFGILIILLIILPIHYSIGTITNYSSGPAVIATYITIIGYIFSSLFYLIKYRKKLSVRLKNSITPMVLLMITLITLQISIPQLLCTEIGITTITMGIFIAVENPLDFLKKRALYDLDTGIKNRNCYDEDLKMYNKLISSGAIVTCLVADINGLKIINDTYGHLKGDEIIKLCSQILSDKLKSAYEIYRIGGDEFAAFFQNKPAKIIQQEIDSIHKTCISINKQQNVKISISLGFAFNKNNSTDVKMIISNADKKMYANKKEYYYELRNSKDIYNTI